KSSVIAASVVGGPASGRVETACTEYRTGTAPSTWYGRPLYLPCAATYTARVSPDRDPMQAKTEPALRLATSERSARDEQAGPRRSEAHDGRGVRVPRARPHRGGGAARDRESGGRREHWISRRPESARGARARDPRIGGGGSGGDRHRHHARPRAHRQLAGA